MSMEEQRELKGRLQNLSNDLGSVEADFSCMAFKLRPTSNASQKHDILIQTLDKISKLRERLKQEEEFFTRELSRL